MNKHEIMDLYCIDCNEVTRQKYKGVLADGSLLYVCQECGCENTELLDKQIDLDDFIGKIESAYEDASQRGFDSIVIAIDTDLDNTYYINDTEDGFQSDVFDYVFEDLYSIASQLYDELHGNVTEIRIE